MISPKNTLATALYHAYALTESPRMPLFQQINSKVPTAARVESKSSENRLPDRGEIRALAKRNLKTPTGGKKSLTLPKSAKSKDTREELAKAAIETGLLPAPRKLDLQTVAKPLAQGGRDTSPCCPGRIKGVDKMKWLDTVAGTIVVGGIVLFIFMMAGIIFIPYIAWPVIIIGYGALIIFVFFLIIKSLVQAIRGE